MILFIFLMMLFWVLLTLFFIFLMNFGVIMITFKVLDTNFWADFELLFNIWSLLFLFLVVLISTSVVIFSFSYMNGYNVNNFILLYLSFVISMLWLTLNNNFYWMMFGWDGLGVVSFLLIVFYMSQESILNGLFTLLQNRLGDLFFVFFMVGVIDMSIWNNIFVKWGLLFLIIGACVKSAQYPFNTWLLAAMSAPTPISSLVHSSTLVVAGVFILLQFSYCLMDVLFFLKYISLMTLFISTFGLLNEFDMKKLIAYSTMSHVSLMMYMMSFKLMKIVYFHLSIHAIFKSLMFMSFGFVMLSSFHSQDKRLVSLLNLNPLIKVMYYFSCLCLAGLPFLSAFFSKDFMIENMMNYSLNFSFIFFLLCFLSVSVYYSMKLVQITNINFSVLIVEKNTLSFMSLLLMILVMFLLINIYISLVFSLSLEVLSFKMYIYVLISVSFFLSVFTNLNFKLISYMKMMNFKETWTFDYFFLDKFIYWNVFVFFHYVSVLNSFKLFLLMNWWVLAFAIIIF